MDFADDGTRGTIAMCSWLFLGIRGYDRRFEFGFEPDMLWRLSAVGKVAREMRANVVGSDIPNPGDSIKERDDFKARFTSKSGQHVGPLINDYTQLAGKEHDAGKILRNEPGEDEVLEEIVPEPKEIKEEESPNIGEVDFGLPAFSDMSDEQRAHHIHMFAGRSLHQRGMIWEQCNEAWIGPPAGLKTLKPRNPDAKLNIPSRELQRQCREASKKF